MKTTLLISLLAFICDLAVYSQTIYVDSNAGDDNNAGTKEAPVFSIQKAAEIIRSRDNNIYTMKINPGIYVLDSHVSVATEKEMTDKRIIIEASILPDDPSWTPEKMPVIITKSKKGEILAKDLWIKDNWIVSFFIDESHVTIRGMKFLGHNYPVNLYYPIARFNKDKTDLLVEQCMFVGDLQASAIQVGVIGHGNGIKVDHCVFYNANNAVIYWEDSGNGSNTGNSLTHCIIYGASGTAMYTVAPNKDFLFANNIVSNCKYVWVKSVSDTTAYSINNSIIVNNQHCLVDENYSPKDSELTENNITKDGNISLRMIKTVFQPIPVDHLHVIPESLGYDIGAGLFKSVKKTEMNVSSSVPKFLGNGIFKPNLLICME